MKWGVIFVVVALVLLPTLVWADDCKCPENTDLVAKFEWDNEDGYVFERPEGNEDIVTIVGDETGGTWTSTVGVSAVVLKGGPGCYTYLHDPVPTSGSFSKNDLPDDNPGGQKPDISNIQFCKPRPTAVRLVDFTARPFKLPWLTALLRRLWPW